MLKIKYQNYEPEIDQTVFVASNACIIGQVSIDKESSIWFGTIIRGDVNQIIIGQRTNIQDACVVHVARSKEGKTVIGSDITIGHAVVLHACTLEDGCLIGMQSLVMDGAVVGQKALVAAGSLVVSGTKIPEGELWAGRPAKFMRKIKDTDLLFMKENVEVYQKLAHDYLLQEN